MLADYLRIALAQMRRYRAQSTLAVLGMAIGVANIILLLGMTDLGRRQATGLLEDFGARLIIVTPFVDTGGPLGVFSQASSSGFIPLALYEDLSACPALAPSGLPAPAEPVVTSAMQLSAAHASADGRVYYAVVAGSTFQVVEFAGTRLEAGRWLSAEEAASGAPVAVLGAAARRELFGDADCIGQSIDIKGQRFEVIGTHQPKPAMGMEEMDTRIFIPLPAAISLTGIQGVHGMLSRYREGLPEDRAVEQVRASLEAGLPAGERLEDACSVWTVKEASILMDSTLGVFRKVLLGVGSIALLVAGMGILNVMLLRVMQRRVEIGIRRAAGATAREVAAQFLAESLVLAGAGSLLGLALGLGGLLAYCSYSEWHFFVGARTLLLAMLFATVCGALSGSYPALRAARLDPVACLRAEQ